MTEKYIVMGTWEGIEDSYTEEYTGIEHDTCESAREELIKAKRDINYCSFFIKGSRKEVAGWTMRPL